MKSHRIRVKIEFEEIDSEMVGISGGAQKVKDGSFDIDLSGKDALDIDVCEQSLLTANFSAIGDALSVHLAEMSKIKRLKKKENRE